MVLYSSHIRDKACQKQHSKVPRKENPEWSVWKSDCVADANPEKQRAQRKLVDVHSCDAALGWIQEQEADPQSVLEVVRTAGGKSQTLHSFVWKHAAKKWDFRGRKHDLAMDAVYSSLKPR